MDQIYIEDVSSVSLNLLNDSGLEWYLDVTTELGKSKITKYGPLMVDMDCLQDEFKFEYKNISYNEKRIISEINSFINNDKFSITQVIEIDKDAFNKRLRGIVDESNK